MKDFIESAKNLINDTNNVVFKKTYKIEKKDILIGLLIVFITNYCLTAIINNSLDAIAPLALTCILIIGTFIIWSCGVVWRDQKNTISFWSKLYLLSVLSFIFNVIQIPLQLIAKILPDSILLGYYIVIYSFLIIASNFMLLKIISLGFRMETKRTLFAFILFLVVSGGLMYLIQGQFGLLIPFFLIGK